MRVIIVEIDFSEVNNSLDFYFELKNKFGFPDFFGNNIHALIDCWTDLRCEYMTYEPMCNIQLKSNEVLGLKTQGLSVKNKEINEALIFAIEAVNERSNQFYGIPTIILL